MEQIFSFRTVSVDIYLHKIKINKGVFKSFRTVSVDIYRRKNNELISN